MSNKVWQTKNGCEMGIAFPMQEIRFSNSCHTSPNTSVNFSVYKILILKTFLAFGEV
jgi:hypothetical protein